MPVSSKLIKSSVSEVGARIDTFEVICPVPVWYEILTHRLLCRNASSTRAIPASKMRQSVQANPSIPVTLTKNQKGMEANQELDFLVNRTARKYYKSLLDMSLLVHEKLEDLGVSKQDCNITLLPFIHFQGIITATEWHNFFNLRNNKAARPDLHLLAEMMQEQYSQATPELIRLNNWHLPYVTQEEKDYLSTEDCLSHSSARCCRVSYFLTDSNDTSTLAKDVERANSLISSGHWSPLEHPATPLPLRDDGKRYMVGQYVGWMAYRKFFEQESGGDLEEVVILSGKEARQLMSNLSIGN